MLDRDLQPASRRAFLSDIGMGFTGLALGAMLNRDGIARAESQAAWAPPSGLPLRQQKAKSPHLGGLMNCNWKTAVAKSSILHRFWVRWCMLTFGLRLVRRVFAKYHGHRLCSDFLQKILTLFSSISA